MIARSHFKNQTAEDNLDVLRVIPLFLNYVSLNSCLQRISRMNFLTQLLSSVPSFSPPLALSSFAQTLITKLHLPQNNTTVPRVSHPCPGNHSVGSYWCSIALVAMAVAAAAAGWGGAAPILITLGEHTCENRCPPGLACCSSLGWRVCVWLCATPLLPSPYFALS